MKFILKRIADIVVSLAVLAVGWPIFAIIGVAGLLTSGLPIMFSQARTGLNGRPFILKKFRTMQFRQGDEIGIFEPGNQGRVTSFGKLLRRSKFDELPQLWNVLKGEMSLVGPRPEVRKWIDAYPERWQRVLSIMPGITDPASLLYRDEEIILSRFPNPGKAYREIILPHKLDIYERYLNNRTLLGDIKIIVDTIGSIILRRNFS